jgi:acyl dehydratase
MQNPAGQPAGFLFALTERGKSVAGSRTCPSGFATVTNATWFVRAQQECSVKKSVYLDDVRVGDAWAGGPITVTEEAIIRFAAEYDPQPMHMDPQSAAKSRFGGIIASGWHVAALVMRDFVDARTFGDTPLLGLSIDQLQWLRPVRPGDTLTIRREIIEVERSKSKPDRGTVRIKMTVTNQTGEVAMSFVNLMQMPARPTATPV